MKTVALMLLIVVAGVIGWWLQRNFSLVETNMGGEYLILHHEQAEECRHGGGCAVWSRREFRAAIQQILLGSQRGQGL